jgi:hypothetical protein
MATATTTTTQARPKAWLFAALCQAQNL